MYKITVVVNMVKDVNSMQEACRNNHEGLGCFFTAPTQQADVISSYVNS